MNIMVIGATGRVGQKLVEILLADGHDVIGTTRKIANTSQINNPHYHEIEFDITRSLSSLSESCPENLDVIYFTTGSRGHDLLQVDLHGAVKTMQLAMEKGIKRYIMLSAIHSLSPNKWTSLIDYFTAKYFADLYLIHQTNLDYTIVQAGYLTEQPGTHKINSLQSKILDKGEISIDDVALTLAKIVDKKNTFKKCIPIQEGDVEIKEAIHQF